MSITYNTIEGDTFELVSRKKYGYEGEAPRIREANPGVSEPLPPGTVLIIPTSVAAYRVSSQIPASNPDEVAITIDGGRFRYYPKVNIKSVADGITTVDFSAPFEHEAPGYRDAFKPFSYKPVEVTVGGQREFKGTMVSVDPQITERSRTLLLSCYSLPGVLNDCTPSPAAFPLEYVGLALNDIADRLIKSFGLNAQFTVDPGESFDKVSCGTGTKIWSFLTSLAGQRNLILTDDSNGDLIFTESVQTGNPVAVLAQGAAPVISVTPSFSPQNYYSDVTGIESPSVNSEGSKYTVKNPRLTGVVRPYTYSVDDNKGGSVKTAVETKAARMFANMVSYNVAVNTWRDPSGALWRKNTTLKLTAPDAMIYNEYEFLIRSVDLVKDEKSTTAVLNLVLPGAFRGEIPEVLPWD